MKKYKTEQKSPVVWAAILGYPVTTPNTNLGQWGLEVWSSKPVLKFAKEDGGLYWDGDFLFSIPMKLVKRENISSYQLFNPDGTAGHYCDTWEFVAITSSEITSIENKGIQIKHNLLSVEPMAYSKPAYAKIENKSITIFDNSFKELIYQGLISDLKGGEWR